MQRLAIRRQSHRVGSPCTKVQPPRDCNCLTAHIPQEASVTSAYQGRKELQPPALPSMPVTGPAKRWESENSVLSLQVHKAHQDKK